MMNDRAQSKSAKCRPPADNLRPPALDGETLKGFRQALSLDPSCAETYYRLGSVYQDQGLSGKAADCFREAMAIQPEDDRFCFCLAAALQAQGNVEEAVSNYRRTLALRPDCLPALYNLGCLFISAARFSEAVEVLTEALALAPNFPQAHNNLGAALAALGQGQQAETHFLAAVQLDPSYAEAHYNLGRLLFSRQCRDEAIPHFKSAIASNPRHSGALFHLALCHHHQKELDAAQACYVKSIELAPAHTDAHLNLARLFLDRHDPAQALDWCRKALAVNPSAPEVPFRAGQILEQLGRFDEALACLDAAVGLQPDDVDAHFNRALMLLRLERFSEGWPEYEWRYKRPNWPQAYPHRLDQPRWDGSAFRGKTLLVHCEQGYGDTLQFARYMPMVKSLGGRLLFEVAGPLVNLLQGLPGVDEVIELSPAGATGRPFDLYMPLLSLPGLFKTTLETVPANIPYVVPDPDKVRRWNHRLGPDGFKVGIVWAGSAWHHNDRNRSCRLAQFMPLAQVPGVRLIGMQKDRAADEIKDLPPGSAICNVGPELNDFTDTAALMAAMDLVISVDTAAVHLAGVMEKPAWVLLPFVPDWRWMLHRENSPWYPSLQLFRQTRREGWEDIFKRMKQELQRLVSLKSVPASRRSPSATAGISEPLTPQGAEDWFEAGFAFNEQRRFEEAIACYRHALALKPEFPEASFNLGNIFLDQRRDEEALDCFEQALKARHDYVEAHFNRGIALLNLARHSEAEPCFRSAAALKPDMASAHYNLGISLQQQARWSEAIECFRRAVALNESLPDAWTNLGTSLQELGRIQGSFEHHREAEACYRRALDCSPTFFKACNNLGKLHQDFQDIEAAIGWYRKAIDLQPDYAEAYFNLATAQLTIGNYTDGWKNYEWRFRRQDWRRLYPRRLTLPRWNGQVFEGRTLWVHSEQGLGDVIQFIRYLPMVKALGGKVVFETRGTLMRLLKDFRGIDRLVEMSPDNQPENEADLFAPLLSLPGILGTGLRTLPTPVPYLSLEAESTRRWADRMDGPGLKVGLVWAGSGIDHRRSLPLPWFTPLTRIPDTSWYGLQKGAPADQVVARGLPKGMNLAILGPEFQDFSDTAAALANLDLMVTVDTSVAHLSGAMGKPTYLLLDYSSEWRWLLKRDDSPWYPTMRLFRQEHPGDWRTPLTLMARRLETLAGNLRKALAVKGPTGLHAAMEFYRNREESIEAMVFEKRLGRASC